MNANLTKVAVVGSRSSGARIRLGTSAQDCNSTPSTVFSPRERGPTFDGLSLTEAPFDRILVSTQALAMPEELIDQLTPEGVMVAPVDGLMLRVHREPEGTRVSEHGQYRFVPLIPEDPVG